MSLNVSDYPFEEMYDKFYKMCYEDIPYAWTVDNFDRELFSLPVFNKIEVKFSKRLSRNAGNCKVWGSMKFIKKIVIKLSYYYHAKHPDEILGTFAHELIHIPINGHGDNFRHLANAFESKGGVKISTHAKERARPIRYRYQCPNGHQHKFKTKKFSQRQLNLLKCNRCHDDNHIIRIIDAWNGSVVGTWADGKKELDKLYSKV